jgi:hypothetical protein
MRHPLAVFPRLRVFSSGLAVVLVFMLLFSSYSLVSAATGVPKILNFQGRLMDENGTLLGGAGTDFCFKFSLYDNETVGAGTKVWPSGAPSTMTVVVRNGIFSVGIGDTNAGGDALDFNFQDNDTVFINIEVADKVGASCTTGGEEVFENLEPRQRIHSSGYAINAGTVGGFLPAQYASGNQIPVLASGNLILGGTDPFLNATTTHALTLQGGGEVSGNVQFFNSANRITSGGHATFAGGITAASSSVTNATSTTLTVTGTASTSNFTVSGNFTLGNSSGILKATAGVVAAAFVDLAEDITGILGVANGGTGWNNVVSGAVLFGNGSGSLATTSQGTAGQVLAFLNGVPTWAATTTFSTGLTYADGVVTNSGVTSLSGTANQIAASGSTGAVTLSLPSLLAITNASSTAVSSNDYITVGRTATTTIRGESSATSTFAGSISMTRASTTATSTFAGIRLSNITNCTKALETDASGNIGCGSDTGVDSVTITTFAVVGSSGTWTKADYAGLTFTEVIVTSGGGGGGGANGDGGNETAGGGGGAGGTSISMIPAASLGTTETATVGGQGTAGNGDGSSGGDGGDSSFGSLVTSVGGDGGVGDTGAGTCTTLGTGGLGGATTTVTGDIKLPGNKGLDPLRCITEESIGGAGGASYWGGGGVAGQANAAEAAPGENANAYGAGGGGAANVDLNNTNAVGGLGGQGIILTMNYTSSGADLAEWYETKEGVEHGDVVAISADSYEYDSKLGLQKSSVLEKATAGGAVVGVVSTAPHETMGYDIFGKATHPQPIALAGRVPVKVTLENGPIKAGDLLTVSSRAGHAMRATKAGVTIGRALEDSACGPEEACTVLIMVHTSYSTGALTKVALRDAGIDMDTIPADLDHGRIILAEMLQNKKEITASTTLSEMLTDRLAAGLEIIAPRVLTNTLVVDAIEPVERDIRIRLVEGGRLLLEKAPAENIELLFGNVSTTSNIAVSIDELGNALFAGSLTAANFEVGTQENPGGITMYDRDTKSPYCLQIVGGALRTVEGRCGASIAGAQNAFIPASPTPSYSSDEAPVITIIGDNPTLLAIDEVYVDAGATVEDDTDEHLELRVLVRGEDLEVLDTSTSTEYDIVYRAIDSDGHVSELARKVLVGDGLPDEPETAVAVEEATEQESESPGEVEGEVAGAATSEESTSESEEGEATGTPEPTETSTTTEAEPASVESVEVVQPLPEQPAAPTPPPGETAAAPNASEQI